MFRPNKLLVSGSSRLSPDLYQFAEVLGRQIIQATDFVLITGGLKQAEKGLSTSDFKTATGAMRAVKDLNIAPTERIITMLPQVDRREVTRFHFGRVIKVKHSYSKSRRYSMVLSSDAVIAIGGRTDGTGEIIDLAWMSGKPVLPIPSTGGAAQECWQKYCDDLIKKFEISSEDRFILEAKPIEPELLSKVCLGLIKRCLKPRCFIAMKIGGHPLVNAFETIRSVVDKKGYTPIRVDQESFIGSIVEAIWEAIRNSEIVIADITGYNPNVFYELGISHALNKQTIITIFNKDGIVPDDIPFDIKVQSVLPYGTAESLRLQLEKHIALISDSFKLGTI